MKGLRLGLRLGGRAGASGFAADINVDSANGNDSNAGTLAAPYQTLSKAATEAAIIGNGVKIGLVAGSYWREELSLNTLTGVDIRGVGDLTNDGLPVIDASDVLSGPWSTSTDRADANTNVYSQTVTYASNAATFSNVWEDDDGLVPATDLANCQATAGSFWFSSGVSQGASGAAVTLYIHPKGSTNPNSDGKTYEFAKRAYALRLGNDCTAKNIWTRKQLHADGSFVAGTNCLAENMLFSQGVKHEALIGSGTFRRCVAWHPDSDRRTNCIMMEFYTPTATGLTLEYDRCIAVGPAAFAASGVQVCSAFTGHTDGGTKYASGIIRDSSAKFASQIFGNAMDAFTCERVYALNCKTLMTDTLDGTLTDVWWDVNTLVHQSRMLEGAGTKTIDGLRACFSGPTSDATLFFNGTNFTVQNSAVSFQHTAGFQYFTRGLLEVSVTQTIIEALVANTQIHSDFDVGQPAFGTMENNAYYAPTDSFWRTRIGGVDRNTLTSYLTAFPESGTTTTDPGLVDPANGDFTLTAPLANGAGLARFPEYTPIPANLTAAESWILSALSAAAVLVLGSDILMLNDMLLVLGA